LKADRKLPYEQVVQVLGADLDFPLTLALGKVSHAAPRKLAASDGSRSAKDLLIFLDGKMNS